MDILTPTPAAVRARSARPLADWQAELRDAFRSPVELCRELGLPLEFGADLASDSAGFALLAPRSFVRRMERGNPRDPLFLQVWPAAAERILTPGYTADPVADASAAVLPGLLHKYAGRVLMITAGACAIHCRYCFRRHFPYDEHPGGDDAWTPAVEHIAADDSIGEVILSGGDPLTASDRKLAGLTRRLAAIPHVKRLRIHTRLPIVIPSRVTLELVEWLTATRLTPIMVVHANHARELDAEVAGALQRLRRAGVLLFNQAVLLRDINDSVEAQVALCERLVDVGVTPYYLHQLDRVQGAAHFDASPDRGCEIAAELRSRLPGYALPQFVCEVPGATSKTPFAY